MNRAAPVPFLLLATFSVAALFASLLPEVEMAAQGTLDKGDTAWMLTATALVLLMTPGLSFFYGGLVGFKSVVSTMLQSFMAMGVISMLWVLVGYSLAFGDDVGGLGIIGNPLTFFMFNGVDGRVAEGTTYPHIVFALFQLKFAIITPALITGAFAERVRFSAYLLFMCLFSLIIYCPLAHMTWHPEGMFFRWGVKDFAGGTVVHMSSGYAALAGALILGRRIIHRTSKEHEPFNIPFVLLGTGMLWFGWFGFNAGSALASDGAAGMAFATTNVASAAAMLSWIFFDWARGRKPSAVGACVGAVVGLVAITPAAGFVTIPQSIFIGTAAAVISNLVVHIKNKGNVDDTLDVFPCHGVGGTVGMVMTGIFAAEVGLAYGQFTTFMYHLLASVIVIVFAFGGSYLLFMLTNLIVPLRVSDEQETEGLDLSMHGETAIGTRSLGVILGNGKGQANGDHTKATNGSTPEAAEPAQPSI